MPYPLILCLTVDLYTLPSNSMPYPLIKCLTVDLYALPSNSMPNRWYLCFTLWFYYPFFFCLTIHVLEIYNEADTLPTLLYNKQLMCCQMFWNILIECACLLHEYHVSSSSCGRDLLWFVVLVDLPRHCVLLYYVYDLKATNVLNSATNSQNG